MYRVKYACNNCNQTFYAEFPKGTGAPSIIHCEKCGCFSAKKCWANNEFPSSWRRTSYPRLIDYETMDLYKRSREQGEWK